MKYKINEAATMSGLTQSTLRYYEKEGLFSANRDKNGQRYYTDEDIEWIKFINKMRQTDMSITDLSTYVSLRRNKVGNSQEKLLNILKKHAKKLDEKMEYYKENRDLISYKIRMYERELENRDIDIFDLYKEKGCIESEKECKNNDFVSKTIEAASYSYSPYSGYRVGACLITKSGKIFTGCNIENVSFTPTNCAERTAIFKAISEGEKDFAEIYIVAIKKENNKEIIDNNGSPCGVCLQVFNEFCDENFIIHMIQDDKSLKTFTLKDLLPNAFSSIR